MYISEKDINQLHAMGLVENDLEKQLILLNNDTSKITLIEASTIDNGIFAPDNNTSNKLSNYYKRYNDKLDIVKFVPASGAASRMFKDLLNHQSNAKENEISKLFFENIDRFPFYDSLSKYVSSDVLANPTDSNNQMIILDAIFGDQGLNFNNLPKGLIPFHIHNSKAETAFQEHLREAQNLKAENRDIAIHFTVGLRYRDEIKKHLHETLIDLDEKSININYSIQSESTDTIALTKSGEILRDDNTKIVFRPGGHGSLLKNLNSIHADLVFIKNIDNISPVKSNNSYSSIMAGYLLSIKDERDEIMNSIDNDPDENSISRALEFINDKLSLSSRKAREDEDQISYIKSQLDRPIRVCGMVKNEGEPGGGPFIVSLDGNESQQIVESSQIDQKNKDQKKIMNSSTHFNPVDIVCSSRDYKGEKYDLMEYKEDSTSFVSTKSYKGEDITILEWPGLWNGAMYYWITLFIEIPVSAFNPVKTVNDLLR